MLFYKEKVDELTRIYHILWWKFRYTKKPVATSVLTKAKCDDALITIKCLRNFGEKINSTETMVLGSSHARMGFIENEKSINFGIDSQDLYYSYKILEKYINIIPNLKNIVLFYGIFSPGHELDKSPQAYRTVYYSAYMDIQYRNKYEALSGGILSLENKLLKKTPFLEKKLSNIPYDLMNNNKKNVNSESMENKWINRWLDLNKRNTQNFYLNNIFKLAQQRNCRVLVVISPYNPRIKPKLPSSAELFESLYKCCNGYNNIRIYNAFDDKQYEENDFLDVEHLSRSGAEKITDMILQNLAA